MTGPATVIRNIGVLATLRGPMPRLGKALGDAGIVENAAVAARDGRFIFVGSERDLPDALAGGAVVIDAQGRAVVPGLVDAHTHLVFVGDRDDEIRLRLSGRTYAEIAAAGGGILKTVSATRSATRDDLAAAVSAHLDAMLLCGTTTAEVK